MSPTTEEQVTELKGSEGEPQLSDVAKLKVVAAMPNLAMHAPFESSYVGILPGSDSRVEQLASSNPAVRALVDGFSDRHGTKCEISIMVVRDDAPTGILNVPALVSFRNAFAISCICRGYQFAVKSPNVFWTLYSDYFDFYPFRPTRDGNELLHMGAALNSLESPKGFRGQPYPELPGVAHSIKAEPDEIICKLLVSAWRKRFEQGRKDWASNRLFRSLATAYHAASLPRRNDLWFYDLGVTIALWVSCLEILSHPGRSGKANLQAVFELLSVAKFESKALDRMRSIKHSGQLLKRNPTGRLYHRLYRARNDFLHGNPVTPFSALYERQAGRPFLTQVAPLVYNVALLCHCGHFKKRKVIHRPNFTELDFTRVFELSQLKKALTKVLSTRESLPF